ncbi:hypothetical protein [Enterococcus faecalis]|uniref:hypothetical protein n=1 Tax=Enterococcus faecalis TaxID=1351 RepID=UPI004042678A
MRSSIIIRTGPHKERTAFFPEIKILAKEMVLYLSQIKRDLGGKRGAFDWYTKNNV